MPPDDGDDGGGDDTDQDQDQGQDARTVPEGHPAHAVQNSDGDWVCGRQTGHTADVCQFPVDGPAGVCHVHPVDGSGPPEGHGSGDPDHGLNVGDVSNLENAPDRPAFEHGLSIVEDEPTGVLEWIEDQDPQGHDWVRAKWQGYVDVATFGRDDPRADDILHAVLMLYCVRQARKRQVERGLSEMMTVTTDGGGTAEVEAEIPVNLPANRITREARRILSDLGVFDPDAGDGDGSAADWVDAAKRRADAQAQVDADDDVIDVNYSEGD